MGYLQRHRSKVRTVPYEERVLARPQTVTILLHGRQQRFGTTLPPKALSRVGSETIVGRAVRLLRSYGHRPVLFAPPLDEWESFAAKFEVPLVSPGFDAVGVGPAGGIAHHGSGLYLLGDVWLSERSARTLGALRPGEFLGRHGENLLTHKPYGELFGAQVDAPTLAVAVAMRDEPDLETQSLWQLSYRTHGIVVHAPDDDPTDDADTLDELNALRRAVEGR